LEDPKNFGLEADRLSRMFEEVNKRNSTSPNLIRGNVNCKMISEGGALLIETHFALGKTDFQTVTLFGG